ncbi:flavin reductase family protein [Sulfitobacter sabulilitoris]|uniref:Flavin reductase n=1 Tax=Sulfitobacter sabulilitoris TaxID=2562655 RepID=A0A5S3PMF8_9RHOB|nr:flavin reductase family protein [Sulfitobacter sabulilitoris]TMM55567.1 flavin reductase [Sulfitobacter sabulilitoris]
MSSPVHFFTPTADTALDLRRAFGRYGTGVTVVTAHGEDGPVGMTANSFASISLDPPLVMWSPAISSRRHDAFVQARSFCIHVLGMDQMRMAAHFAKRGHGFDAFEWENGPGKAPALAGCVAVFHCDTHAVHPAGDHSLILGRVRHVALSRDDRPGLLFDQGRYGQFVESD